MSRSICVRKCAARTMGCPAPARVHAMRVPSALLQKRTDGTWRVTGVGARRPRARLWVGENATATLRAPPSSMLLLVRDLQPGQVRLEREPDLLALDLDLDPLRVAQV